MNMHRRQMITATLAAGALVATGARAQSFPDRPITLVVAYPPGGDSDATARVLAEKLTQRLKQTVLVDNKPGAGGVVGNAFVSKARPDGHTLLFTPNPFTSAPAALKLAPAASYDPINGFDPVILTGLQSVILCAHPDSGIRSIADVVAQAKAGKPLSYASPGAGSPMHIVAEWLNHSAGIRVQHIPFRGVGPMLPDMLTGRVTMGYITPGVAAQHLKAGKLVAVALTDAERSPLVPGVPTIAEQGFKEIKLGAWNGIFAPKGTPGPIIATLNAHLNEILKMPDVVEKMGSFGTRTVGGRPEALAQLNSDEFQLTTRLIRELNIQAD